MPESLEFRRVLFRSRLVALAVSTLPEPAALICKSVKVATPGVAAPVPMLIDVVPSSRPLPEVSAIDTVLVAPSPLVESFPYTSQQHTSERQSLRPLACRLLLATVYTSRTAFAAATA